MKQGNFDKKFVGVEIVLTLLVLASGKVKSVSDVGKSVEFPKRKLVEESLLLNKRMILIEIEALKQQLRDLNEVSKFEFISVSMFISI